MTVVHQAGDRAGNFGPYLGGRQVRLAVSGLCRVLPLNYAGTGLTGAHRDMARVRGVSAADRAALAHRTAAVLSRDPAEVTAVTARLIELRDAAASTLAFELAARLQQEIEALDWVTAEQKVTRPGDADHDACGWSDGTLLRFEIRAGRLAGWTLRACGEPTARRHLAATLPDWAAFAQRNAELAARLLG